MKIQKNVYAGIEWMNGEEGTQKVLDFLVKEMGVEKIRFPESSSIGIKPISVEGSERLIRGAIEYAINNNRPSVTLVHKGNIMKFTEGAFKNYGYALAERDYGIRYLLGHNTTESPKQKAKTRLIKLKTKQ